MTDPNHIIAIASKAFSKQEYENALALIQPLIEEGNAAATGMLGLAYQHGCGVDKNGSKAVELLQKAVELGDVYAAHNLGRLYLNGMEGIEADIELSNIYHQLAEEMGLTYEPQSEK